MKCRRPDKPDKPDKPPHKFTFNRKDSGFTPVRKTRIRLRLRLRLRLLTHSNGLEIIRTSFSVSSQSGLNLSIPFELPTLNLADQVRRTIEV